MFRLLVCGFIFALPSCLHAQEAGGSSASRRQPAHRADHAPRESGADPAATLVQPIGPPSRQSALPQMTHRLTLRAAEDYALANQPRLAVSSLNAQAQTQRVYEARSAFFPQLQGNAVGVKSKNENDRLAAVAGITDPTILSRQSDGLLVSQLITDFGRTYYLTTSARAGALSASERTQATRETVLWRVDQAYFAAQGAQSLLEVANQAAATNGLLLDRTRALAVSSLKSSLDVSFAETAVSQAKLVQLQARARLQEAYAELAAALGLGQIIYFRLVPQELEPEPPGEVGPLVLEALAHRPDLLAARADRDAATRFAKAERAARYPAITGLGGYGITPAHRAGDLPPNYGAIGVDVNIPVFTGGLLSAREREAVLRAQAAQKVVEDQETDAARDVYIAWMEARTAYQGIAVTRQLLDSAQQAFQLAQGRYNVGTSSVVELSQAELQQVQAQISAATSRFDYQVRRRALDFQLGSLR